MEKLKEKILKEGRLLEGNILKVDSFLNHQLDVKFLCEIGKEFRKRFEGEKIDKILTIEASGIAIAAVASMFFDNVPVVFAKKTLSQNLGNEIYVEKVFSFTKGIEYNVMVSKKYLNEGENILILDDFLANGVSSLGLANIVKRSGANLVGVGIVIEKSFQNGISRLNEANIRVESLARIKNLSNGVIEFM